MAIVLCNRRNAPVDAVMLNQCLSISTTGRARIISLGLQ